MSKVIGMGNVLVDVLAQVESESVLNRLQLPKGSMQLIDAEGYEYLSNVLEVLPTKRTTGGSAANTMLALACLGGQTGLIGKTGDDVNGNFFAANCRRCGIEFVRLIDDQNSTGVATVFITPDGQRTFGTYLGAAANMKESDLKPEFFEGCDYFYVEGYLVQNHDLIDTAFDMARAAGLKTCLDLASYNIVEQEHGFFEHLLKKTDIVFANQEESYAFAHAEPEEALEKLADYCETAVVKVGSRGAIARRGSERAEVPAMKVNVVDTTAAGDYFAAGFLYGLTHQRSLQECARIGALLSGHVVQTVGTRLEDAVWKNIKENL